MGIVATLGLKFLNEETGQSLEISFDPIRFEGQPTSEEAKAIGQQIGEQLGRDLRMMPAAILINGDKNYEPVNITQHFDWKKDLREGMERDRRRRLSRESSVPPRGASSGQP